MESRWNYNRGEPLQPATPSFAPDGSWFVFDSPATGGGDIYRARRGAAGAVRLTSGPEVEQCPVLSFDTTHVAYIRKSSGYEHLWLMDPNGSNQTQLTRGRVLDSPLTFSSDGSKLFFVRRSWRGRALLPRAELFSINLLPGFKPQIDHLGPFTSVSMQGDVVAWTRFNTSVLSSEIWVSNRVSRTCSKVTIGYAPSLSPDGRRLVSQPPDLKYDTLRITELLNGEAVNKDIPVPYGPKTRPFFSSGGQFIAFRILDSERGGKGSINLIHLDNLTVEKIEMGD